MHHAHKRADHVTNGIAFRNDKPIKPAPRPKTPIEVARLRDAISADEGLTDHENLVWVRECAELGQRRHEARVVVAAASRVDEDDVETRLLGVRDGVGGDVGGVFAVALFEQVDLTRA
jgi:hypothetical protein